MGTVFARLDLGTHTLFIADVTDISCQVGDTVRIELRPLDVKDMERVYRKS